MVFFIVRLKNLLFCFQIMMMLHSKSVAKILMLVWILIHGVMAGKVLPCNDHPNGCTGLGSQGNCCKGFKCDQPGYVTYKMCVPA